MKEGAIEDINYGEYHREKDYENTKVIKGIKKFYNHTINEELYSMFVEDKYWDKMAAELRTKNTSYSGYGTEKYDTEGAYIPRSLLDHHVSTLLEFEGYKIPILFAFPYLDFHLIKKYQKQVSEVWRLYWVNPRFFKYNLDALGFCFVFNNALSDDVLYEINEYFYFKYGEHLFYHDSIIPHDLRLYWLLKDKLGHTKIKLSFIKSYDEFEEVYLDETYTMDNLIEYYSEEDDYTYYYIKINDTICFNLTRCRIMESNNYNDEFETDYDFKEDGF